MLYKLCRILALKTTLNLYYCLIHSHISYEILFYLLTYKTPLKHLQTAQNAAIRAMLFCNSRVNITFSHRQPNNFTVQQHLEHCISTLTFKFLSNLVH